MKTIRLTNGEETLVDDEDFERFGHLRWRKDGNGYAVHNTTAKGKSVCYLLHRLILDAPRGVFVDHRNGRLLDNRKSELRLCSRSQNQRNLMKISGTSRFKGVSWDYRWKKWVAGIGLPAVDGRRRKSKYLGLFVVEKDAARTYDAAALELYGEFAKTNEMLGLYSTPEVPRPFLPLWLSLRLPPSGERHANGAHFAGPDGTRSK